METVRELLEMAAKACGWTVVPRSHRLCGGCNVHIGGGATIVNWNPLRNDGQALPLAVKLELTIGVHHDESQPLPWLRVEDQDGRWTHVMEKEYGKDPCAATRRAIVLAAAEIGRAMP